MKVVRLSAIRTGRLYPPGNIPGTHFCLRLSQPQGHSAAGKIMSMKNPNDTNGNRTRDLPACSAVPQPTALQRARSIITQLHQITLVGLYDVKELSSPTSSTAQVRFVVQSGCSLFPLVHIMTVRDQWKASGGPSN